MPPGKPYTLGYVAGYCSRVSAIAVVVDGLLGKWLVTVSVPAAPRRALGELSAARQTWRIRDQSPLVPGGREPSRSDCHWFSHSPPQPSERARRASPSVSWLPSSAGGRQILPSRSSCPSFPKAVDRWASEDHRCRPHRRSQCRRVHITRGAYANPAHCPPVGSPRSTDRRRPAFHRSRRPASTTPPPPHPPLIAPPPPTN